MSNSSVSQPRRRMSCLGWGIVLVMLVLGYSAIRNILDWNSYNKGHQAYQQADCAQAIRHFDSVINGWRLADLGKIAVRARQQREECDPFQAAVEKQQAGETGMALLSYMSFMDQYRNSVLAGAARNKITSMLKASQPSALASQDTCAVTSALLERDLIPQPDAYLPPFYLACGQVYDNMESWQSASAMYKSILTDYPNHSLAPEAEKSLIENPLSCEETDSLKNSMIAQRSDFMPSLYYHCAQKYEENADFEKAMAAYEQLLGEYPNHALAPDAEAGLARSIVTLSKANSVGEIPEPDVSGTTGSQLTEVVVLNHSPERLRIVFSGPISRVVELEACISCTVYTDTGPLVCPEQGPIGHYMLDPGRYDIVVEAISESGVTPWTGNWNLQSGNQYSSCFYISTTLLQQY